MAQAVVLDDETTAQEESTPEELEGQEQKRGRGRPPGTRQPKRWERESTSEEKIGFMEYTSGLTQVDWEDHILYVYQWAPVIDLTRGGLEKKYRKVYTQHRSEEDIKRDLGSGTYELRLNKTDRKSRKEKTIDRVVISIMDYDFPPNIPPGAWLDDSRNADWIWAKPLLEKKFSSVPKPGDGNMNMAEVLRFLEAQQKRNGDATGPKEQLMSSVIAILPQLLQQQNSAQDPSKLIDAIAKMKDITAVKSETDGLLPMLLKLVLEPKADPMLPFILKQLEMMQTANTELMKQMMAMKSEAAKPQDPINMVDTMLSLVTKVQGIVQPAAPLEPWQQIVSEGLPGLIDLGKSYFTSRAMYENAKRPQQQTQAKPVTTQPQVAAQPNPPQIIDTTAQTVSEEQNGMDQMEKQNLVLIANLAAQALNLGLSGAQFADQMVFKFGEAAYNHFTQTFPKDGLIAKFKAVPEVWGIIGAFEAQLPQFVEDFYAPPEEEEPEPEPIVVAPAPKKGGKKK